MKAIQKKSARVSAAAIEAQISAAVLETIDATKHYSKTIDAMNEARMAAERAETVCGEARQAESDRKKELVMLMKKHGFTNIRTGGVLVSCCGGESVAMSKDVFVDMTA